MPSPPHVTRSVAKKGKVLPHLPVELQLRILSYAMTSPFPIVDPLSPSKKEHLLEREKGKPNQIAIHFLATCRAYHLEGTRFLWMNNTFVFTSPQALRTFADLPLEYRRTVRSVNFRIIAKYYDDEERTHRLPSSYHPVLKRSGVRKLVVSRRPKEHTLARGGFRAYAYYQLIDFLEAMLPPLDPPEGVTNFELLKSQNRPRLLPHLESLHIDFVSFGDNMFMYPPAQLHDIASHQMGCSLNELIVTGLPGDDAGFRVSAELGGLLKAEGLLVEHVPLMIATKHGMKPLQCYEDRCNYLAKVVRAMPGRRGQDGHDFPGIEVEYPPAPPETEVPPPDEWHSCRTIWKKVPIEMRNLDERTWMLFDRMSGMPWDDVLPEVAFLEKMDGDSLPLCDHCGERHHGALVADDDSFYSE